MSDIKINSPIEIEIDQVDFDGYLPSVKMSFKIMIHHPAGNLIYTANDIWFLCEEWSAFEKEISTDFNEISLKNMSENFILRFSKNDDGLFSQLSVTELLPDKSEAAIRYAALIDHEIIAHISRQLSEFPKSW